MNTEIKNFFLPIWSNEEIGAEDNPYPYLVGNCICSDKSLLDLYAETRCHKSQYIEGITWREVYDGVTNVLLTYMIKDKIDDSLALEILHIQSLLNRFTYVVNSVLLGVRDFKQYNYDRLLELLKTATSIFPSNYFGYIKLIAYAFDEEMKKLNL